jgi:hypothetical protein
MRSRFPKDLPYTEVEFLSGTEALGRLRRTGDDRGCTGDRECDLRCLRGARPSPAHPVCSRIGSAGAPRPVGWVRRRVGDFDALDFCKRRERVNPALSFAHDVFSADSTNQQGHLPPVTDGSARAAPQRTSSRLGRRAPNELLFQALRKLGRLHVIGITSKGDVSPSCVR